MGLIQDARPKLDHETREHVRAAVAVVKGQLRLVDLAKRLQITPQAATQRLWTALGLGVRSGELDITFLGPLGSRKEGTNAPEED